jgi:hypothetical protein
MNKIFRPILAVTAGMVLALALVMAVEVFSSIVHPVPPNFTGTMEEMCEHVARYPQWVLGVAVIAWSATTFLSTWIATKIGGPVAGAVVSLLLLLALAFNITKLPYATWFKVVMPASFLVVCYVGVWPVGRGKPKTSSGIAT